MEVRILASDLDTYVLAHALYAVYPVESVVEMDSLTKRRHFLRGRGDLQGSVQVKPNVRDLVTFRQINLVADPWPIRGQFDAIFCRNVIIYFDRETQRTLFERLTHYLAARRTSALSAMRNQLYWLEELLTPVSHSVYRVRQGAPHK